MNMPNRTSGKTKSAPGKRHLDSTKPLAAPSSDEITAAGTVIRTLLRNPASSFGHTWLNVVSDSESGSCHMRDGLTCARSFKAVTSRTYTGMRNRQTSANSVRYRATVTYSHHCERIRVDVEALLMSDAPNEPSTRCTGRS